MTVAVAHSDTARGEAAVHAAATEAVLRGEDLAVLHIIPGVDEPQNNDPLVEKQVAAQLDGVPGLNWKLYTAPEKLDTAEALLEEARQVGATLLVIGSRHRTAVGKLLLGSTVQRVLLDARIPVLVVKAS